MSQNEYHALWQDFKENEHNRPEPTGSRYQRNKAMVDELLASMDVTKIRVTGEVFAAACKSLTEEQEAENRQLDHLATEHWLDHVDAIEPDDTRYEN